jgi:hypothetical protein
MTPPSQYVQELLERYGAAWNGHDLDAIMAEHTPDSVFQLRTYIDSVSLQLQLAEQPAAAEAA